VPAASGALLTFACGGHPLPVVVRADGTAATHGAYGSLIGVFEGLELATTTIDLAPGDTVVLYTDGATDLAPPHGFSTDEFTAFVKEAATGAASVEAVADALHGGLSAVLPIAERDDDIALLILRLPE
jgi:serine phosphatase RsbU (regulator of sigma subunit)